MTAADGPVGFVTELLARFGGWISIAAAMLFMVWTAQAERRRRG